MHDRIARSGRVPRWVVIVEVSSLTLLLAWLFWLPLPYGSVIDSAQPLLIVVPLVLCVLICLTRISAMRSGAVMPPMNRPLRLFASGGLLFAGIVALQLIPLPPSVLNAISPESLAIWTRADHIVALTGISAGTSFHPVSVDPPATWRGLFRLLSCVAAFALGALLVTRTRRAIALCLTLGAGAAFQTLYGIHDASARHHVIWGWENKLVLDRISGTFVNPNHFAHYLAIILPLTLYLGAVAWHASAPGARIRIRIVRLVERNLVLSVIGLSVALACLAGILMAQSRGAIASLLSGVLIVGGLQASREKRHSTQRKGRRFAARSLVLPTLAIVVIAGLVAFLGYDRTVARFNPSAVERGNLVGRLTGLHIANGVWRLFPLLGSGLGTFESVESMAQTEDLGKLYNHAHDDYAEIAATTGTAGIIIVLVTLIAGYVSLVRLTFTRDFSWLRQAFMLSGLTSLTIAMLHALVDFNSFIPANPATLAVIVGATVAPRFSGARKRSSDVSVPVGNDVAG